jgi:tetratricopeptide (TPR) repeat protein
VKWFEEKEKMSIKDMRLGLYNFSSTTAWYLGILLGMAIATGLVIFIFFTPLHPGTGSMHNNVLIGILTLLGMTWMAVWGWHFVTSRYIIYFISWIISLVQRFLTNGLVRFLVLIFIVVFIQRWRLCWLTPPMEGLKIFNLSELLQLSFIITTLSLTLIILLFVLLYKSRKRIVISEFLNHTGQKELDAPVKGIAPAIVSEIVRLVNLYKDIDEIQPSAQKSIPEATLSITAVDKDFEDALGGQFEVQVGAGMKINVGSLFKLLGRLIRGPKLCGCLQKEGNKLILTAWITRGRMQGNWRVHSKEIKDVSVQAATEKISGMIEEMTCRLFMEASKFGSPRWEVAKHYAKGLRKYREAKQTENNRIQLHEAMADFNTALGMDNRFAECYYNLGIIYNKLDNKKSAKAAFRKSLEEKPGNYNSYYELSRSSREDDDHSNARWFCEQAINLQPSDPNTWNLWVVILYEDWYKKKGGYQLDTFRGKLDVENEIIRKAEIAVMLSWKALCRAKAKGESAKIQKDKVVLAVLCIRNLAVLRGMKLSWWTRWLFKQAFFLSQDDNDLNFELGKYYYRKGNFPATRKAFSRIYEDALDVDDALRYWASYTHTNAIRYHKTKKTKFLQITQDGSTHFLDIAADMLQNENVYMDDKSFRHRLDQCINIMAKALDMVFEKKEREFWFISHFIEILGKLKKIKDIDEIKAVHRREHKKISKHMIWAGIQLDIAVAKQALEIEPNNDLSIRLLKDAIGKLVESYPRQIKKLRLHMYLAEIYLDKKALKHALFHAGEAVQLNPFKPEERLLLGKVHRAFKSYDKAIAELECSFQLAPDSLNNLMILAELGETYKEKGENACKAEDIQKAFSAAIKIFEQALIIVRSTSFLESEKESKQYAEFIGIIHFFLGTFHYELVKYDTSAAHFRTAAQMGYEPVLSLIKVGWSYINAGSFSQAKYVLDEADRIKNSPRIYQKEFPDENKKFEKERHIIEIKLGQAAAFAEGAVDVGKEKREALEGANNRLNEVFTELEALQGKGKKLEEEDRRFIPRAWAMYHESRGLIYLKEGYCQKALFEFEQAVDHRANARLYLRIAKIHRQCAAGSISSGMRNHIFLARNACTLCKKHNIRQKYGDDIERLLKELDELEKKI